MSTLRARTIRLANEHPDLQPLLLPILAEDAPRVAADAKTLAADLESHKEMVSMLRNTASWAARFEAKHSPGAPDWRQGELQIQTRECKERLEKALKDQKHLEDAIAKASKTAAPKSSAGTGKKPVKSTAIRSGYYESGDKIGALESAVKADPATSGDKALLKAVGDLQKAHEAVFAALKPYNWD